MRSPLTSVRFAQVMRVGHSWEKGGCLGDLKDAFQMSLGKQSGMKERGVCSSTGSTSLEN